MIWLTWRQFRASSLTVLGVLALAAVALAGTGPELGHLLQVAGKDFFVRLGLDQLRATVFYVATAVTYVVPAVVGAFWGAPLVARELEAGTHRLAWSQSISRTRWLAVKLGITGLGAAVAGLIGLAVTWWCAPIDDAIARGYSDRGLMSVPRLWPELFGTRGVVPVTMALLALVIGVTAGLVIRRSVPAMAATLVVVVAAQVAFPLLVQSHLVAPKSVVTTITPSNLRGFMMSGPEGAADPEITVEVAAGQPGAWITENRTLGPDGDPVKFVPGWVQDCAPERSSDPATLEACFGRLADAGYRQRVEYHPASQFWAMQWRESGILLALAGLLTGFCFWRLRRDLV